jgi:hypothetical protein
MITLTFTFAYLRLPSYYLSTRQSVWFLKIIKLNLNYIFFKYHYTIFYSLIHPSIGLVLILHDIHKSQAHVADAQIQM